MTRFFCFDCSLQLFKIKKNCQKRTLIKNLKMVKFDLSFLTRKKIVNEEMIANSKLDRVMSLLDVTAIGVSYTMGTGIYVIAGAVITQYTGPSFIFTFLIAGLVTFLSGINLENNNFWIILSGNLF